MTPASSRLGRPCPQGKDIYVRRVRTPVSSGKDVRVLSYKTGMIVQEFLVQELGDTLRFARALPSIDETSKRIGGRF